MQYRANLYTGLLCALISLFSFSLYSSSNLEAGKENTTSNNRYDDNSLINNSQADSLVLVDLYNSTNGPNWLQTWDLSTPMDTWDGVTINTAGRVTCLDLDGSFLCNVTPYDGNQGGNQLVGNLPASIGQLTYLEKLLLSENDLSGPIPSEIGNLTNLIELNLEGNLFTGDIPESIYSLTNLTFLSLAQNQLTGNISTAIQNLTSLELFAVSFNNLSGTIPAGLGLLTNLRFLYLEYNYTISGEIPNSLKDLTSIEVIELSNNSLSGEVPSWLAELPNLTTFGCIFNGLSGCFPSELSSLCGKSISFWFNSQLPGNGDFHAFCDTGAGACPPSPCSETDFDALIDIYNAFGGMQSNPYNGWAEGAAGTDCDFCSWGGVTCNVDGRVIKLELDVWDSGASLSPSIGDLSELEELYLYVGSPSGDLPSQLGGLLNLKKMSILGPFTGQAPSSLGNMVNLEELTLINGQIEGLGAVIPNMINLQYLNLSNNPLNTDLSSALSNLVLLREVWLSGCGLTNSLDLDFSQMTNLEKLSLGYNQLTGAFPSFPLGSPLTGLSLDNNGFSGSLSGSISNLSQLTHLILHDNEFQGALPADLFSLSSLEKLHLRNNNFEGVLPNSIGTLLSLDLLLLDNNNLEGSLPSDIGDLPLLTSLDLGDNNFEGCIPESLLNLCDAGSSFDPVYVSLEGNSCLSHNADFSLFCADSKCELPVIAGCPCTNGIQDGYETGIDCGGYCGPCCDGVLLDDFEAGWGNWIDGGNNAGLSNVFASSGIQSVELKKNGNKSTVRSQTLDLSTYNDIELSFNYLTAGYSGSEGFILEYSVDGGSSYNNLKTWTVGTDFTNGQTGAGLFTTDINLGAAVIFRFRGNGSNNGNNDKVYIDDIEITGCFQDLCFNGFQDGDEEGIDCGGSSCVACPACAEVADYESLMALYNSTGGAAWLDSPNWQAGAAGTDCNICEYEGVLCSNGRVISINLTDNNLIGTLPSELGNLSFLTNLNISQNPGLTGSIPTSLSQLSTLTTLNLSENNLTGEIPVQLTNLSQLLVLNLFANQLTGSIPNNIENLSQLNSLNLKNNFLSGPLPIELGQLDQLTSLYLNSNSFTGSIPAELGTLSSLVFLELGSNLLVGEIPTSFSGLTAVQILNLQSNNLSGSLWEGLATLPSLSIAYLNDNNFYGCIPQGYLALCDIVLLHNNTCLSHNGSITEFCSGAICQFTQDLNCPCTNGVADNGETDIDCGGACVECQSCDQVIDLQALLDLYNSTNGPMWADQSGWTDYTDNGACDICLWAGVICDGDNRVTELRLSGNGLDGTIPSSIGSLSQLVILELDDNNLIGELPSSISQLQNLTTLDLFNNGLTGTIPSSISSLSSLEKLNLSSNELTGTIPTNIGDLQSLSFLGLSSNYITGEIPPSIGTISGLIKLYLSNNNLSGEIPPSIGGLSQLIDLFLNDNFIGGEIPPELQGLVSIANLFLYSNELEGCIPQELLQSPSVLCGKNVNVTNNQCLSHGGDFLSFCSGAACEPSTDPACLSAENCFDGLANGEELGVDCGGPDCPECYELIFSDISLSSGTIAGGEQIILSYSIINNGPQEISPFKIDFYLASSDGDTDLDHFMNGTLTGPIAAGESFTGTQYYTLPTDLSLENYFITGIVDGNNAYNELDEDNNSFSLLLATDSCDDGLMNGSEEGIDCGGVTCPDCYELHLIPISLDGSVHGPGQVVDLSLIIDNDGPQDVNGFDLELYLSTSLNGSNISPLYSGNQTDLIVSGGTYYNTFSLTLPSDLADDTYFIVGKVDNTNTYNEIDESNNIRSTYFYIEHCADGEMSGDELGVDCGGVDCPDCYELHLLPISLDGSLHGPGQVVDLSLTMDNDGPQDVNGFDLELYLSTSLNGSSIAPLYSGNQSDLIVSGGTYSNTFSLTLPADLVDGTYFIVGKVDNTNSYNEIDESNNIRSTYFSVEHCTDGVMNGDESGVDCGGVDCDACRYNLTNNNISLVTDPSDVCAGSFIYANSSITNSGQISLQSFPVNYYLLTEDVTDPDQLTGDPIETIYNDFNNSPSVGETLVGQDKINIPDTYPPGDYFLVSFADPNDYFDEANENDNLVSIPIELKGPDFEFTDITVDQTNVYSNQKVGINHTLTNAGCLTLSNFTYKYYLSVDDQLITDPDNPDADLELAIMWTYWGDNQVDLLPGEVFTGLDNVDLPSDLPLGDYYLFAFVDPNNVKDECLEDNNIAVTQITVEQDLCTDGVENNDETGIDCGGPNCEECLPDFVALSVEVIDDVFNPTTTPNLEVKIEYSNQGQVEDDFAILILLENVISGQKTGLQALSHVVQTSGTDLNVTHVKNLNIFIPSTIPLQEEYILKVWLDPLNKIIELNDDNNIATTPISISSYGCCDRLSDDEFDPEQCEIGPSITWPSHYMDNHESDYSTRDISANAVGSTEGFANVNPLGAATYSIPIALPEGVNGLEPSLSLNYISQLKSSRSLGLGWSLGGVSSIVRTARTIAHHGEITKVKYDDTDSYNLDGHYLIEEIEGTYKTQLETYSEIIPQEIESTGPSWFLVKEKSGLIKEYGNTIDSKVQLTDGPVVNWYLNKVTDSYGNQITYTYDESQDEKLLKNISYGFIKASSTDEGSPNIEVDLNYSIEKGDKNTFYQNGKAFKSEKLLSNINIESAGLLYKKYELSYGTESNRELAVNTQLIDITEIGADGSQFNSTRFKYGDETDPTIQIEDFIQIPYEKNTSKRIADLNGDGYDDVVVMKVDDDAKTTKAFFYLNQGNGSYTFIGIKDLSEYVQSPNKFNVLMEVALGIGVDVLLTYFSGGSWGLVVANAIVAVLPILATPTTYNEGLSFNIRDINGDNKEEIIFYSSCYNKNETFQYDDLFGNFGDFTADCTEQVVVTLGVENDSPVLTELVIGNGLNSDDDGNDVNVVNFWPNDFDGDSKIDFMFRFKTTTTFSGKEYMKLMLSSNNYNSIPVTIQGISSDALDEAIINFGDYDGDKISDMLITGFDSGTTSKIYHLDITNTETLASYTSGENEELVFPSKRRIVIGSGDFNGDGLTDILTGNSSCSYEIGYSDGNKFIRMPIDFDEKWPPLVKKSFRSTKANLRLEPTEFLHLEDMNNDGKTDIVFYPNSNQNIIYDNGLFMDDTYIPTSFLETVHIYYSTGQNFVKASPVGEIQTGGILSPGDFNGDGTMDFMIDHHFATIAKSEIVTFKNFSKQYLLTEVLNGFNSKTSFEYANLTDSNVYDASATDDSNFPINTITPKFNVVQKVTVPNGLILDKSNEKTYKYGSLKYHRRGGGFLGFERTEVLDHDNDRHIVALSEVKPILRAVGTEPNSMYVMDPISTTTSLLSSGQTISVNKPDVTYTAIGGKRHRIRSKGTTIEDHVNNRQTVNILTYTDEESGGEDHGNVKTSIQTTSALGSTDAIASKTLTMSDFNSSGTFIPNKPETITYDLSYKLDTYSTTVHRSYHSQGALSTSTNFKDSEKEVITSYTNFDQYGNPQNIKVETSHSATAYPLRETTIAYDATGRYPESVANPLGQETTKLFSKLWSQPTSTTSIDGLETSYSYDGFGRINDTTSPTGSITTIDYDWTIEALSKSIFKTTSTTLGLPTRTLYYDVLGREVESDVVDFGGIITRNITSYDKRGRTRITSNPHREIADRLITSYDYDDYNRPSLVDHPTNDQTYTYLTSSDGIVTTTITTQEGKTYISKEDVAGKLIEMIDPGNITTAYDYYAHGNPKNVKIAGVEMSTMMYDIYAQQTSLDDKGGFGIMNYDYNAFGELIDQTDPKGNHTHIDYDILGRPDLVTVAGESVTDYTYVTDDTENGLNQLSSVSYAYAGATSYTNSESYTYDEFSRPASKTELINETEDKSGESFTHNYLSYNLNNQVNTYTFPSGLSVTNHYDDNGYLSHIDGLNGSTVYTVNETNAYGQITKSSYGNGLICNKQHDIYGLPERFWVEDNSAMFDMGLSFDNRNGNLIERVDMRLGSGLELKEAFGYDDAYDRLESVTYIGQTPLNNQTVSMTYEANGNIKTKTDVSPDDYSYDATKLYQVDKIQNVIADVTPPETIVYNAAQQPISLSQSGGTEMIIQYGADDQRRYSVLTESDQSTERYYIGDYEKQILPDGTIQEIHYVGGGVITLKEDNSWSNYYAHTDHLGSVLAVSDQSGNEYARQSFDAWGRKRNPDDLTFDNVPNYDQSWLFRGYTGHEMLPEFDLINMNGRLYDNVIGRMLSPDNYSGMDGTSQGYNRYSYVLNNPLKYTDPSGEIVDCWSKCKVGTESASLIGTISSMGISLNNMVGNITSSEPPGSIVEMDPFNHGNRYLFDDGNYYWSQVSSDHLGVDWYKFESEKEGWQYHSTDYMSNVSNEGTSEFTSDVIEIVIKLEYMYFIVGGGGGRAAATRVARFANAVKTTRAAKASIQLTKARFGHTFTTHGDEMTNFLINRAKGSGMAQGQFLNNQKAAKFILDNVSKTANGAVNIPIPKGFPARVIMPDGTFKAATHIRLVPGGKGVKTSYPLIP